MNLRKNTCLRPNREWSRFVSRLDLTLCAAGLGEEIADWPNNLEFADDSFFRLYFPVEGMFRMFTPDSETVVAPGGLYLFPPMLPLKHLGVSPCTHYYLHFTSRWLQYLPEFQRPLQLPVENREVLRRDFDQLMALLRQPPTLTGTLEAEYRANLLAVGFLENFKGAAAGSRFRSEFDKVLDYIEIKLDRELKIAELAAVAQMTSEEFSPLFRHTFGLSPKRYLIHRRISLAKQLLLETDRRVKEIALACGYEDEFFFCRLFRKYAGRSPSDFRRNGIPY